MKWRPLQSWKKVFVIFSNNISVGMHLKCKDSILGAFLCITMTALEMDGIGVFKSTNQ